MRRFEAIPIDTLDDPRIACYRNLKDRELARLDGRFVAEGELVVRRLLVSDFPTESVLAFDRLAEELGPLLPGGVPLFVAPAAVLDQIIGYRFHAGALAVGRRKPSPRLEDLAAAWQGPATLVVLPELISTENLGAILRISAAFGVSGVILGPRCCDAFYRQAVRVSMGAVFSIPLVRSVDLAADLAMLHDRWGVERLATVLDDSAEPLHAAGRPQRIALLLGNEAQGLSAEEIALCDRRVTIPMKLGTDSLNVSVAAGVFLYHFTYLAVC